MLRLCYIFFLTAILFYPGSAQVVVDASSLSGRQPGRFLPDVEGKVVVHESYMRYLEQRSPGSDIELFPGWPKSSQGSQERGGVYGNLDKDNDLELVYPTGTKLFALNADGTPVPGWPRQLDHPTDGAAAFGDIDGDGAGEIVVTTHQTGTFAFGSIYAFETDGTDVEGFPVATEGGGVRTPVLADLDGDQACEIVITMRDWPDGLVYVFYGNGEIYPGWPVRMDYVPGSDVAVGDIDGDEIPEIVTQSYYGLHAFTREGTLMPGFPYYPGQGRVFSYSTPVLADIDGDGDREIICGDHSIEDGSGAIHIVKPNGVPTLDWPLLTSFWIYGPPSIGDIDDDGQLDIVVGDQTLSAVPVNQVYAWNALSGEPLAGFPVSQVFGINSQIILADLDGDGMTELLADDNTENQGYGRYVAFNHDGSLLEDFEPVTVGSTFFINPMVLDIDGNGILDLTGGGTQQEDGVTNLYLWNTGVPVNPLASPLTILQYNTRHSGVYGDTLMVGVTEQQSPVRAGHPMKICPNPATSQITVYPGTDVHSLKKEAESIHIYDSRGRKKHSSLISEAAVKVDLENFSPGIYLIEVKSGSRTKSSGKFVVVPH